MKRTIIYHYLLLFAFSISAGRVIATEYAFYPTIDKEIAYHYDDDFFVVESDGQALPAISWVSSPPHEYQFVCEFDLSSLGSINVAYAELHFNIERVFAYDAVRLDAWMYDGNGTIEETDYNAGDTLLGTWNWDSPSPGTVENIIQEHVYMDVTEQLRNCTSNLLGINFRLAGDRDDYDGNVFIDSESHHILNILASETGTENGPWLKIYSMPPQDTNSWQMKQKDIYNTGRAAVRVAADRMNDTFFDTVIWQKRSNGGTGAFFGTGMIYYDGAGPDGADVTLCSNTWPNGVTCVDRHTGKLYWQDTPGGGDHIGRMTQAFSNDGTTIYATQDGIAAGHRAIAFPTTIGPGTSGANIWGNGADAVPAHLQMQSPTVAPDGRIFLHQWDGKVYAGSDNGSAISETWSCDTNMHACYSDAALYDDDGTLKVIQTGRGGRVSAFDGNSGTELWYVNTYAATDASATIDPDNGNIYVPAGFDRELYIVGLDIDGNPLWNETRVLLNDSDEDENLLEEARSTGCLSHDGRTFYFQSVGPVTGKLYAINTSDGSLKWSYPTNSWRPFDVQVSSPVVTQNGVVIVGNNYGGQYMAIKDNRTEGILLDTFDVEHEWNDEYTMALASASLSPDGLLYLPLRTLWTASNGDGETPDEQAGYFLTAFDLVGCDGDLEGDINGDCKVNLTDLAEIAANWLTCRKVPSIRCDE